MKMFQNRIKIADYRLKIENILTFYSSYELVYVKNLWMEEE